MPSLSDAALLREITTPKGPHKATRDRFHQAAVDLIWQETLIDPAFSFRIIDLDEPLGDTLRAGGEQLYAPRLLPASGRLTALACGVATIGPRLEQRVGSLFKQRHVSLALALDTVGNDLLFAAGRRLQDRMIVKARQRGLTAAGELRPGDPGLSLDMQGTVLRLADAAAIGVRVTHGQVIHPLKSNSMVLGIGINLPPAQWSRCDDCRSRPTCKLVTREMEMAAN